MLLFDVVCGRALLLVVVCWCVGLCSLKFGVVVCLVLCRFLLFVVVCGLAFVVLVVVSCLLLNQFLVRCVMLVGC